MNSDLIKHVMNSQIQKISLTKGYYLLLIYKLREKLYQEFINGKSYFLEIVNIDGVKIFMHQPLNILYGNDIHKISLSTLVDKYGLIEITHILKYHFEKEYKDSQIPGRKKVYELGWQTIEKIF